MLPYDRLVLSPGIDIDFDSIPGYSEAASERMPHAWKTGPQMPLLKKRLDALTDGSMIVMVTPPNPYRCPPGPYERASVMAHALKVKGHKSSRIIILDPKDTFSKQALFQEGWEEHYPGMIEWQDPQMHGGIVGVDPDTMEVKTDLETYRADLANIIPEQRAGRIARDAGFTDQTGYCPIEPTSMRTLEDHNIHIIGDACIAGDMPKAAFSANSQAKVVAMTIMADLAGRPAFPARYATVCWSFIAPDDTVKVGGSYRAKDGRIASVDSFISQKEDNLALRKRNGEENLDWYAAMAVDIFG
jgi:NADPH-dependent 2,4-dienoyl-CoA reductase/sulfur reductase-like enzyme